MRVIDSDINKETGAIVWLEDDTSFSINNEEALMSKVVPQFFKEIKMSSFTRRLTRWGFKTTTKLGHQIFKHDLFKKGRYDLVMLMRCPYPSKAKKRSPRKPEKTQVSPKRSQTGDFKEKSSPKVSHHQTPNLRVPLDQRIHDIHVTNATYHQPPPPPYRHHVPIMYKPDANYPPYVADRKSPSKPILNPLPMISFNSNGVRNDRPIGRPAYVIAPEQVRSSAGPVPDPAPVPQYRLTSERVSRVAPPYTVSHSTGGTARHGSPHNQPPYTAAYPRAEQLPPTMLRFNHHQTPASQSLQRVVVYRSTSGAPMPHHQPHVTHHQPGAASYSNRLPSSIHRHVSVPRHGVAYPPHDQRQGHPVSYHRPVVEGHGSHHKPGHYYINEHHKGSM